MKGLVEKDFFVLIKTLKTYIFILVAYSVIGITSGQPGFFITMLTVMMAMMPITSLAYDERSKWDKYALTMPITRKDIVLSKYMLGAVLSLGSCVLATVIMIFVKDMEFGEKMLTIGVSLAISFVYQAVVLPLIFKFGSEKGRVYMFIVFFAPAILVFALAKLGVLDNFSPESLAGIENMLPFILIAAVVVLYVLSILLSLKFYYKKEL